MSVHTYLKYLYLPYLQSCSMATGIQNEKCETPQDIESPKEKNIILTIKARNLSTPY